MANREGITFAGHEVDTVAVALVYSRSWLDTLWRLSQDQPWLLESGAAKTWRSRGAPS